MKTLKLIMIAFLMIGVQSLFAQKYISKDGHVWFNASTPLENIEAHNRQSASILDAATGELVFNILIKSFEFKVTLMQEHFNENYMESGKFPKATFKGKITNLSAINFVKNGSYNAEITGDLTIHGVTKPINTKGLIVIKDGAITATSKFIIEPKNFDIVIPKLVEGKIAKQIDVNVDITYKKM
jgi:polyisoprenoid-binding protein YceI